VLKVSSFHTPFRAKLPRYSTTTRGVSRSTSIKEAPLSLKEGSRILNEDTLSSVLLLMG